MADPSTLAGRNATVGSSPPGEPSLRARPDRPGYGDAISGIAASGFLPGTHIATPAGEVPVDCLPIGYPVLTLGGAPRPIQRIGEVRVLASPGRDGPATPILVRKNALADNVPNRDLWVMKSRPLNIDGALIPVELLVNHRTILWGEQAEDITIYRLELETPAILLANGTPLESSRDDAKLGSELVTCGPQVDAAWMHLVERAGGQHLATTKDPDLHLRVDGRRLHAASRGDGFYRFGLAARPADVRIVSRSGVPQELGIGRDPRRLGVAVQQIVVLKGRVVRTMEADDPSLVQGFHAFDAETGLRWTDGDARVPASLFDRLIGPLEVFVQLGGCATYATDLRTRRAGRHGVGAEAEQ
jgi:hypothetical protein